MRSNICHFDERGQGRIQALRETEKVAAYCELGRKESLRLRLLAEELAGMMQGIAGDYEADFWIEEEDGQFCLVLSSNVKLDREAKEQLVAVSTSGRNEAAKGLMGKIASLFETYIIGDMDAPVSAPILSYSLVGVDEMRVAALWSMQAYKSELAASGEARAEEWDELEKSIVANLADEITVGVRSTRAEIRVFKRF